MTPSIAFFLLRVSAPAGRGGRHVRPSGWRQNLRPAVIEWGPRECAMRVRRVVTGHDRSGKAVFVSDLEVQPTTVGLMPGAEFHKLWGGDRTPSFPDDGASPPQPT